MRFGRFRPELVPPHRRKDAPPDVLASREAELAAKETARRGGMGRIDDTPPSARARTVREEPASLIMAEKILTAAGVSEGDLERYRRIVKHSAVGRIFESGKNVDARGRIVDAFARAERFKHTRARFASLDAFHVWIDATLDSDSAVAAKSWLGGGGVDPKNRAEFHRAADALWTGKKGLDLIEKHLRHRVMTDRTLKPAHDPWRKM